MAQPIEAVLRIRTYISICTHQNELLIPTSWFTFHMAIRVCRGAFIAGYGPACMTSDETTLFRSSRTSTTFVRFFLLPGGSTKMSNGPIRARLYDRLSGLALGLLVFCRCCTHRIPQLRTKQSIASYPFGRPIRPRFGPPTRALSILLSWWSHAGREPVERCLLDAF